MRHVSSLILEELAASESSSAFHQWGFRAGHSTGSALYTTIIDNWPRSMGDGKPVCSVIFDIRKAFDQHPQLWLPDQVLEQVQSSKYLGGFYQHL